MPYTPVIDDILEVRIWTRLQDQAGLNIRHFKVTSVTNGGATLAELLAALDVAISTPYRALLNDAAEYMGIDGRKILPAPDTVPEANITGRGFGGVTGALLPKQTSGIISLRTDTPGRHGRGRLYVSFPSEEDNTLTSFPAAGYVTRLQALASVFVGTHIVAGELPLSVTTITSVVLEKVLGGTHNIRSAISRDRWGTQRRRGSFGASNTIPL